MVIYREFKELKGVSSPVHWAMGMFDGVHLGHAGVIAAAWAPTRPSGIGVENC